MASQFVPMPDGSWAQQVATGGGGEVTVNSNSIIPVDIQNRLASTIQTHNAVSVPLSGNSIQSTWMDLDGFDKIAFTMMSDSGTVNNSMNILWSNDGATQHGYEVLLASSNSQTRSGITDIKSRYAKVQLVNADGAAAHTMSAWAYLKS